MNHLLGKVVAINGGNGDVTLWGYWRRASFFLFFSQWFKKKSEVEKLEDQYKKKMKEGYDLQSIDRSASDQKYVEADQILKKIELLEKKWLPKKLNT